MKQLSYLSILFLAIFSCNNQEKTNIEEETTKTETTIGGEKDEHGCLIAAGETWSELKQSCVQIFNVGKRLAQGASAVKNGEVINEEAKFNAFVLFNDDQSKAEIFLPGKKETVILDKTVENTYQKDTIKYDALEAALYINNEVKFKGE